MKTSNEMTAPGEEKNDNTKDPFAPLFYPEPGLKEREDFARSVLEEEGVTTELEELHKLFPSGKHKLPDSKKERQTTLKTYYAAKVLYCVAHVREAMDDGDMNQAVLRAMRLGSAVMYLNFHILENKIHRGGGPKPKITPESADLIKRVYLEEITKGKNNEWAYTKIQKEYKKAFRQNIGRTKIIEYLKAENLK